MTTTINASTSAGLVQTADTSGSLALQTANTTALTINSSQVVNFANAPTVAGSAFTASQWITTGSDIYYNTGNVGIGVTPSAWTSSFRALQINTGGTFYGDYNNTTAYFGNNAYFNGTNWKYISSSYALYAYQDRSAGKHVWAIAPSGTAGNNVTWTEAMTLNSSGQLVMATSTYGLNGQIQAGITASTSSMNSLVSIAGDQNGGYPIGIKGNSSSQGLVGFYDSSTSIVGSVSKSGSNVAYNTSSDYRLKENIAPMTGALAKVAQLKPVTYKWKADGKDGQGFIAHELAEVVPDCVNGEKDAVDADNNPIHQGVDTSFLVATLTAAIQELKAINDTQAETINALTARIVALESKA